MAHRAPPDFADLLLFFIKKRPKYENPAAFSYFDNAALLPQSAIKADGNGNRILLGVPTLGAMARYTPEELASLHVLQQEYDMQVPVLSGSF